MQLKQWSFLAEKRRRSRRVRVVAALSVPDHCVGATEEHVAVQAFLGGSIATLGTMRVRRRTVLGNVERNSTLVRSVDFGGALLTRWPPGSRLGSINIPAVRVVSGDVEIVSTFATARRIAAFAPGGLKPVPTPEADALVGAGNGTVRQTPCNYVTSSVTGGNT
jgi:hypothetical protein